MISQNKIPLAWIGWAAFSLCTLPAVSGYGQSYGQTFEAPKINCPAVKLGDLTIFPGDGTSGGGGPLNLGVGYCSEPLQSGETFDKVMSSEEAWPVGNYPAPIFVTKSDVSVGGLIVPAGRYSMYLVPSNDVWKLILNKQTQQTAAKRDQAQDLGTISMSAASPPDHMIGDLVIIFEEGPDIDFDGARFGLPELHFMWGNVDVFVLVTPLHAAAQGQAKSTP